MKFMRNKKRTVLSACTILSIVACVLSGCGNRELPTTNVIDVFCDEKVDVTYLRENGALFFEGYALASGKVNHVFRIDGGSITDHKYYDFVDFDPSNYEHLAGKNIYDVVKTVGIPSYLGNVDGKDLDYSNNDGRVRRLHFSEIESDLTVKNVETFVKSHETDIKVFFDKNASPVSKSKIKNLKVGMCADEVLEILGSKINGGFQNNNINDWRILTLEGAVVHLIMVSSDSVGCLHLRVDTEDRSTLESWYLFGAYSEDGEIIIQNRLNNSSVISNAEDNRFSNSNNMTLDFLRTNGCFFFGDYVFASDSKNHVFKIKDGDIESHRIYDKIAYPRNPLNLFSSTKGMDLEDTFEIIGIPSFATNKGTESIDYVLPNGYLMSCRLDKKVNRYLIKSSGGNSFTWSFTQCWKDAANNSVQKEKIKLIKNGMCVAEVTEILGKATSIKYADEKKNAYLFTYLLDDDTIYDIKFKIKPIDDKCVHAVRYDEMGTTLESINSASNNVAFSNCFYLYVED